MQAEGLSRELVLPGNGLFNNNRSTLTAKWESACLHTCSSIFATRSCTRRSNFPAVSITAHNWKSWLFCFFASDEGDSRSHWLCFYEHGVYRRECDVSKGRIWQHHDAQVFQRIRSYRGQKGKTVKSRIQRSANDSVFFVRNTHTCKARTRAVNM